MPTAIGVQYYTTTSIGIFEANAPYPVRPNCYYYSEITEYYVIGRYGLFMFAPPAGSPEYLGAAVSHYYPAGSSPSLPPEYIQLNGVVYRYSVSPEFISKVEWFEQEVFNQSVGSPSKPTYIDLLSGYQLDPRTIPASPTIIAAQTELIKISYYKVNRYEPIPGLRSIDWFSYDVELQNGNPISLPIVDCVLGTLYCSSPTVTLQIIALPTLVDKYEWADLLPSRLSGIFANWYTLYANTALVPPLPPPSATVTSIGIITEISRTLRILGANNNVWNNRQNGTIDLNVDLTHPMFLVDTDRSYNWHQKPVSEGIGDLVMDSPRTIETHTYSKELRKALQAQNYQVENLTSTPPVHYLDWHIKNSSGEKLDKIYKALDAEQWGTNPDDPAIPRVANLGHLISRIASLLGYRPEPDGTFDPAKEKALVRQIVNKNEPIDATKVGVNNFGSLGMIMRRLNNSFKGKKIVADECVIIRDIPQIMAEYQDQLNLALGLQESSAIEIKGADNTARYDNQLAVMIELLNLVKSSNESIRAALVSSLVAQAQSSEIIAALGLPTVTKSLPVNIDNKIDHLPYKGVSAHRSISQEIAVCTANVGIVLGQVL